MKKNKTYNFAIGLIASIFVHVLVFGSIFYYQKTKPVSLKSQKVATLVMSLNTFVEAPKQEMIVPKPKPKPKPKHKNEPKPKKIEKPKPQIVHKPTPVLIPEPIKEIVAEEEVKDDIVFEDVAENTQEVESVNSQVGQSSSLINKDSIDALINAALNKHKVYPERARRMNIEGKVEIEFKVDLNKKVISSKILKSSGYGIIDKAAIILLEKASKDFPELDTPRVFVRTITYNFEK